MIDSTTQTQIMLAQQAAFNNFNQSQNQSLYTPNFVSMGGQPIQEPTMPGGVKSVAQNKGWGYSPMVTNPIAASVGAMISPGNAAYGFSTQMEVGRQWLKPRAEHMGYWAGGAAINMAGAALLEPAWSQSTAGFYKGVVGSLGRQGINIAEDAGKGILHSPGFFKGMGHLISSASSVGARGVLKAGVAGLVGSVFTAANLALLPLEYGLSLAKAGYKRYTQGENLAEFSKSLGPGMMPTIQSHDGTGVVDFLNESRKIVSNGGYAGRSSMESMTSLFTTAAQSGAFIGAKDTSEMQRRMKEHTKNALKMMKLLNTTLEGAGEIMSEFSKLGISVDKQKLILNSFAQGKGAGLSLNKTFESAMQGVQQYGSALGMSGAAQYGIGMAALGTRIGPVGNSMMEGLNSIYMQNPMFYALLGGGKFNMGNVQRGMEIMSKNPATVINMIKRMTRGNAELGYAMAVSKLGPLDPSEFQKMWGQDFDTLALKQYGATVNQLASTAKIKPGRIKGALIGLYNAAGEVGADLMIPAIPIGDSFSNTGRRVANWSSGLWSGQKFDAETSPTKALAGAGAIAMANNKIYNKMATKELKERKQDQLNHANSIFRGRHSKATRNIYKAISENPNLAGLIMASNKDESKWGELDKALHASLTGEEVTEFHSNREEYRSIAQITAALQGRELQESVAGNLAGLLGGSTSSYQNGTVKLSTLKKRIEARGLEPDVKQAMLKLVSESKDMNEFMGKYGATAGLGGSSEKQAKAEVYKDVSIQSSGQIIISSTAGRSFKVTQENDSVPIG
jgi:hypothetical protein